MIELHGLTKSFGNTVAVDGVSLQISEGEIVSLIGASGCGKTTLARMLVGLETPNAGEILLDGTDLDRRSARQRRQLAREIQMVFQDPYSSLSYRLRVCDIVAEPLQIIRAQKPYQERVSAVLRTVGLSDVFLSKYAFELSGGERQRVALARSLIVHPRLLIADETVSMLDSSRRVEILDLLLQLRVETGLAMLFITHDIRVAAYMSDRIAVMQHGKIVESGDTKTILESPVHAETRALVHAAALMRIPYADD